MKHIFDDDGKCLCYTGRDIYREAELLWRRAEALFPHIDGCVRDEVKKLMLDTAEMMDACGALVDRVTARNLLLKTVLDIHYKQPNKVTAQIDALLDSLPDE